MVNRKHVFISYVSEDSKMVGSLANTLRSIGINVWLDRDKLFGGMRWKSEIKKAIRDGMYFLACFSDNYSKKPSSYMNEELLLAVDEIRLKPFDNTWFIPIRLTNCSIPEIPIGAGSTLRDLQWIDLFGNVTEGLSELLAIVNSGFVPSHHFEIQLPRLIRNRIRHFENIGAFVVDEIKDRWLGMINNQKLRVQLHAGHIELSHRALRTGEVQSDRVVDQCKNGRVVILTVAPYEDSKRLCQELCKEGKTTSERYSAFIHKQMKLFCSLEDWWYRDFIHLIHSFGDRESLLDMFYIPSATIQFHIVGKLSKKQKGNGPIYITYADIYPVTIINSIDAGNLKLSLLMRQRDLLSQNQ